METKYLQTPEKLQKVRGRTAVIVKGNPAYITGNALADKFYNNMADYLRKKNYAVSFDAGEPHTMPPKADLWVAHSRGASRLAYKPKGQVALDVTPFEHPVARMHLARQHRIMQEQGVSRMVDLDPKFRLTPPPHHYFFTKDMQQQLDSLADKKADFSPEMLGGLAGTALGGSIGMMTAPKGKKLSRGLKGGAIGGGLGLLGGAAYNAFQPPSLTNNKQFEQPVNHAAFLQQEKEKAFVDQVGKSGVTTPRAMDQVKFNDLDQRIEMAKQYRSANPQIKYLQDLDKFDRPVPVHLGKLPGTHAGGTGGFINVHDPDAFKEKADEIRKEYAGSVKPPSFLDKLRGNKSTDQLPYINAEIEKYRQEALSQHGHVHVDPAKGTPYNIKQEEFGTSAHSTGNGKYTPFDMLEHEVKGHGPQVDNIREKGPNPAQQWASPSEHQQYLASQPELERRIQATKDYATQVTGKRPNTAEEFKATLERMKGTTIDLLRPSDAADLNRMLDQAPPEKRQQLLDYILKLAPGIVQQQQQSFGKQAEVKGPLFHKSPSFEKNHKYNRYEVDYKDKNVARIYHKIKTKKPSGLYIEPNYENKSEGLELLGKLFVDSPETLAKLKLKRFTGDTTVNRTGLDTALRPFIRKD